MADVNFPRQQGRGVLLPVKRAVRVAEHLEAGDEVWAYLEIIGL
jgi:hypothetical protein